MKNVCKILVIALCCIISTASAQNDSSILITDNQAKFFAEQYLESQALRADTSHYLKIIQDYKLIRAVDSMQVGFLIRTSDLQHKEIQKQTQRKLIWRKCTFLASVVIIAESALLYFVLHK